MGDSAGNNAFEKAGFLLIELVVSLALLVGVGCVITNYYAQSVLTHASVALRLQATSYVASWLDEYRVKGDVPKMEHTNVIFVATTKSFTPNIAISPQGSASRFTLPSLIKRELMATYRDASSKRYTFTLWQVEKKV